MPKGGHAKAERVRGAESRGIDSGQARVIAFGGMSSERAAKAVRGNGQRRDEEVSSELTQKQVAFLAGYLSPKSPTNGNAAASALAAGYAGTRHSAEQRGYKLLQHPAIRKAIAEYHAQTAVPLVADLTERKAILSRIAREVGTGDVSDYVTAGKDGAWISFGPESRNRLLVRGIESTTSENGAVVTKLKLAPLTDAVAAVKELNEMEGIGKPQGLAGQLGGVPFEIVVRYANRKALPDSADAEAGDGAAGAGDGLPGAGSETGDEAGAAMGTGGEHKAIDVEASELPGDAAGEGDGAGGALDGLAASEAPDA